LLDFAHIWYRGWSYKVQGQGVKGQIHNVVNVSEVKCYKPRMDRFTDFKLNENIITLQSATCDICLRSFRQISQK